MVVSPFLFWFVRGVVAGTLICKNNLLYLESHLLVFQVFKSSITTPDSLFERTQNLSVEESYREENLYSPCLPSFSTLEQFLVAIFIFSHLLFFLGNLFLKEPQ